MRPSRGGRRYRASLFIPSMGLMVIGHRVAVAQYLGIGLRYAGTIVRDCLQEFY